MKKAIITFRLVLLTLFAFVLFACGNSTKSIDILESLQLNYSGVSGEAKPEINVDSLPTVDDNSINEFIHNDIKFSISPNSNLSDGDIVIVTAVPNAEKMKELNISIPELSKSFTVEGLDSYVNDVSQVDIPKFEELAEEWFKNYKASNFPYYKYVGIVRHCFSSADNLSDNLHNRLIVIFEINDDDMDNLYTYYVAVGSIDNFIVDASNKLLTEKMSFQTMRDSSGEFGWERNLADLVTRIDNLNQHFVCQVN
jgi:hypothetical protein